MGALVAAIAGKLGEALGGRVDLRIAVEICGLSFLLQLLFHRGLRRR
jgi:hypothetical protein